MHNHLSSHTKGVGMNLDHFPFCLQRRDLSDAGPLALCDGLATEKPSRIRHSLREKYWPVTVNV